MTNEIIVHVDGGCLGNGTDNAVGYGSYTIRAYKAGELVREKRVQRIVFDDAPTNNAAEVRALLLALSELKTSEWPITIYSDSQLLVNWMAGAWHCKKAHLIPLVKEARSRLAQFPRARLEWVSRTVIEAELGH